MKRTSLSSLRESRFSLLRPAHILAGLLLVLALINSGLYVYARHARSRQESALAVQAIATAGLGLSDLCIATEARYTRHPAASDHVVPFMDHPGAIEHFPTGSFWAPPLR